MILESLADVLCNGYLDLHPRGQSGERREADSSSTPSAEVKPADPFLHAHIRHHGVVPNQLRAGATLCLVILVPTSTYKISLKSISWHLGCSIWAYGGVGGLRGRAGTGKVIGITLELLMANAPKRRSCRK
jgi:hypothetical protein